MEAVYQGAKASKLFTDPDIKTRAICFDSYTSGADDGHDFIHVQVKLLSGRSISQRTELSESVMQKLNELAIKKLSITVQITDIEKQSYSKIIC